MNKSNIVVFFNKLETEGSLKQGAPAWFAADTGTLIENPTRFLRSRFVQSGKSSSKLTWKKAAYALATWWDFLDALEIEWEQATKEDLMRYRDMYLESVSPRTGQIYDSGTVSYRMAIVCKFYQFQADRGEYEGSILGYEKKNSDVYKSSLLSTDFSPATTRNSHHIDSDLFPKATRGNLIRPYTQADWAKLMNSAGKLPSVGNPGEKSRNALLLTVALALALGIRISELSGLSCYQFLSITDATLFSQHSLEIKGKGNKKRMIKCPGWLVLEINLYITGEREEAAKASGKRICPNLFLTESDSKSPGKPLSNRRIQEIHNILCFDSGLVRTVMRDMEGSGTPEPVEVARYRVHDLRHTYAVWTYHALKQAGDREPWKYIQAQLGHSTLTTTLNTYLKYVAIFDSAVPHVDLRTIMKW